MKIGNNLMLEEWKKKEKEQRENESKERENKIRETFDKTLDKLRDPDYQSPSYLPGVDKNA